MFTFSAPPGFRKRNPNATGSVALALGEVSGHAHAVRTPGVEVYENPTTLNDTSHAAFMFTSHPAEIKIGHEEHGPVEIPAEDVQLAEGLFTVSPARYHDYDANAARAAQD